MQSVESDEHSENDEYSMRNNLEPLSNVMVEREDPENQPVQSVSTEEGMQIDDSDEQSWNAQPSIQERLEPDSNSTADNARHPEKQYSHSVSTEEGMQIIESDVQ
jgi:mannitol-1-phosphate/altronate dehydrogenase